ncbi:MAG: S41 family peptidase, partial [Pseudomonadota bacterium]
TMIAFVPFMIEEFTEVDEQRYLVTNISDGFEAPPFEPGVEVLAWNGIAIQRAVEIQGDRFAGSNLEARRARGTATLTVRRLLLALPPDENFVIVEYRDLSGQSQELRVDWMVISEPGLAGDMQPAGPRNAKAAASIGSDLEMEAVQHIQKYLYAGHAAADEVRKSKQKLPLEAAVANAARPEPAKQGNGFAGLVPSSVMDGRAVQTTTGEYGYIRIRSFRNYSRELPFEIVVQSYVDRFIELAESLPQIGLIVDVRGNGGGIVTAGERLLQLMTPRRIQPEPTQFITSPLNLDICRYHAWLAPWVGSLEEAVLTGAQYSRGIPMTSVEEANDTGQRYFGPVVLVTDALCYSTTDIFAAGFQDHEIGLVIGVHNNTGAGGANVWTHNDFIEFFYPPAVGDSPYRNLPQSANMRVSMRRTMRVNENAGTPVEDLGVVPNRHHPLTRNDILNGNEDMLEFAGSILADMPKRSLRVVQQSKSNGDLILTVETHGLTGCDVFADGRAQGSIDIEDGLTDIN